MNRVFLMVVASVLGAGCEPLIPVLLRTAVESGCPTQVEVAATDYEVSTFVLPGAYEAGRRFLRNADGSFLVAGDERKYVVDGQGVRAVSSRHTPPVTYHDPNSGSVWAIENGWVTKDGLDTVKLEAQTSTVSDWTRLGVSDEAPFIVQSMDGVIVSTWLSPRVPAAIPSEYEEGSPSQLVAGSLGAMLVDERQRLLFPRESRTARHFRAPIDLHPVRGLAFFGSEFVCFIDDELADRECWENDEESRTRPEFVAGVGEGFLVASDGRPVRWTAPGTSPTAITENKVRPSGLEAYRDGFAMLSLSTLHWFARHTCRDWRSAALPNTPGN